MKLGAATGRTLGEMFHRPKWTGGTESAMFNRLEEIAEMEQPVTPFLQVTFFFNITFLKQNKMTK